MTIHIKEKSTLLIEELLKYSDSDSRDEEIFQELNNLLIDPNWSDYIFWSDDYLNNDESINYDKFFDKVFDYSNSEEYLRNQKVVKLVNNLLQRDFTEKSEMDIINEVNELSSDLNWMQHVFVDKSCLHEDGSLNEELFLDKLFNK